MRYAILIGFLCAGAGYIVLGKSPAVGLACAALVFAHAGGSMVWVFSSTILQLLSADRLRGRVFSAESAFNVITLSIASSTAGALIDHGWTARAVATANGAVMLVPALLWAVALLKWPADRSSN